MTPRRALALAAELLVAAAVVALLAGQVLGQPVLLGYVETGSMAPTMAPGDGFVAVPAALAGPLSEGDVVTFRAESLQGGGLTTHRVVGETDAGYRTKGDANPFPDQSGEEPPVKRAQIVAVALRVGGDVVVIPNLGTAIETGQSGLDAVQRTAANALGTSSLLGTQGVAYLLLGASALTYLVDVLFGGADRDRTREPGRDEGVDPRLAVGALALVVVLAATASMVLPAGTQQYGVVSAEADASGPRVIEAGEAETVPYGLTNGGVLPVRVYLAPGSEGVSVEPAAADLGPRSAANVTVTLSAPPETGFYRQFVVEYRYLALLPADTLDFLYAVHPWAPIVAIDAALGGSFYLSGRVLVGDGPLRRREREGPDSSVLGALRRAFR